MAVHIQFEDRAADGGETYRTSGNLLLDRVLGVALHALPEGADEAAADAAMERHAEALAAEGRRLYVIHSAPMHPPLGGLGYVLLGRDNDYAPKLFPSIVFRKRSMLTTVSKMNRASFDSTRELSWAKDSLFRIPL